MGQTKRESTAPIEEQTSRKRRRTIAPSDENVPRPFEIKGVPNTNDAKNVRVVARIRPLSKREEDQQMVLKAKGASIVMDNGDDRKFDYDAVFGPTSTQWDVYHQSGARDAVCGDILQGFNCTILAYGQTGSGKTFTMGTASSSSSASGNDAAVSEMDGIIPRAVHDLFGAIATNESSISVEMSFLEIYNEEARDLLSEGDADGPSLFIREGQNGEVYVQNLTWKAVSSQQEVAGHMNYASDRRVVASTNMNSTSSRSHAICTLRVTSQSRAADGSCNEIKSKLTLVDLAGSERAKRTGAEGSRMKEGININKGLFVLGQVVSCLSQLADQSASASNSQHQHIPYRDSKLTRLLQDSLGGNSRTIMVACVSPADSNTEESINTLRYASRARSIQNSAVKNIVEAPLSPRAAAVLRRDNQDLRKRVIQLEAQVRDNGAPVASSSSVSNVNASADASSRTRINELECMVEHLREQVRNASKDVLEASLKADQYKIQYDRVLSVSKSQGVEIEDESPEENEKMFSLVQQLREEVEEWKAREAEARINAEVSRVTAASIISSGGDLKIENLILPMETEENDDEDDESEEGAQLASELLCLSGTIDKKEEMVKKALLEKQCMEAMKSHFEGALQSLQTEVETLSAEREELLSVVDCITDDKTAQSQMKDRIAKLEKRIAELQNNANDHKKSLRLRELAEKRVRTLEQEIQADKQKKAELQRKLKEESAERRREKKKARLEATRLMKDSNRLKLELQKVKMAAERQALVLKRKTEEIVNNHKRQHENSRKSRSRGRSQGPEPTVSDKKQDEIVSWLDSEVEVMEELIQTRNQIADHEMLLEEALKESCSEYSVGEEVNSRKQILKQLRSNLESMEKALVDGFKDANTWKQFTEAEVACLVGRALEMMAENNIGFDEKLEKEVASTKERERKGCNEEIMKLRLQHSHAMASLLDSTRKTLESQMIQQLGNVEEAVGDKSKMDQLFKDYFQGAEAATANIRNSIDGLKTQQNEIQDVVNEVTKGLIPVKKTKKKKSIVGKELVDYEPLEDTFIMDDLDDGNDSDWSPEDEKTRKKDKRVSRNEKIEPAVPKQGSNKGRNTPKVEQSKSPAQAPKSPSNNASEPTDTSFADAPVSDFLSESFSTKAAEESFDASHVESSEASVASSADDNNGESLEEMKVSELKERLRDLGLKLSGRKAELKARLESYQASSRAKPASDKENRNLLQTTINNSFSLGRGDVGVRSRRGRKNPAFMKDNTSFSVKRRRDLPLPPASESKRRLREDMNNSVTLALRELHDLSNY